MPDINKSSIEIVKKSVSFGCTKAIVLVSSGKDSVCLMDVVLKIFKKVGITPYCVHHYIVANLDIEEEVLTELEMIHNVKIYRYQNSIPKMALLNDMLCINIANDEMIYANPIKKYRIDTETDRTIFKKYGTKWMTSGIKKADSLNRRFALNEYPNPNPNKKRFYPLTDWKNADVTNYIKKNNLPSSRLYKIFKRSFDSLDVQSVYPLKSFSPKDYDRICDKFPLMDVLCWMYEKRVSKYGINRIEKC